MHLHLDAVGGVAGDMFIAALLDAFPHLHAPLIDAVRLAGLPSAVAVSLVAHHDHALGGKRFIVQEPGHGAEHEHGHEAHHGPQSGHAAHGHDHVHGAGHGHRSFADIRALLQASGLAAPVREHAIAIFTLLAQAEAKVHGTTPESISFHEVGEWDSIADIVGAAFLIDALAATWSVGALPLGSGRVRSAHGILPVPAPATVLLLEGFDCFDDGFPGERVTPTGAAILRHLRGFGGPRQGRCAGAGTGFGTRRFPAMANVLRVLVLDPDAAPNRDRVAEILFEVDDQTAEDLAIGLDRIRQHAGTRDVLQLAALGKKGRMTTQVRVLADPQCLDEVTDLCLLETATIGLRFQVLERKTLARRQIEAAPGPDGVRAKEVQRLGSVTRKAEADDLRSVAGYAERERIRRAVAAKESP